MRLRRKQLNQYYLKAQVSEKNNEGSSYETYSDVPFYFMADISPASGQLQAEIYGVRLSYILNMLCEPFSIKENDGICVYVKSNQSPDYKVISIRRYEGKIPHISCELEKIR